MEWKPEPSSLMQLIELLKNTQSSDNQVQHLNHQRLDELRKVPDFINYLLYVLTSMSDQPAPVRAVAGLLLKNNVRQDFFNISPEVLSYVKQKAIESIGDADTLVRHTLGTIIATIVKLGTISGWPEVLSSLLQLLGSSQFNVVDGAWDVLHKICEECSPDLEKPLPDGTRPLNVMIPEFLKFFSHENAHICNCAIETTTIFVSMHSEQMQQFMDGFVTEIFKQANHTDSNVRRSVCKGVVAILETRPDKLLPEMENVVNYMLFSTQSDDKTLAMEACEFWLSFCEQDEMVYHLKPHLGNIVPVLLKSMVYDEEDLLLLDADEEDAVVPDSEQDIKPRHHQARTHDHHTANQNSASGEGEDDDDEDYDDDDDDEIYGDWNLRKCSAASIDVMATVFSDEILEYIIPYLKEQLFSDDWKIKEAGILALGAIAEGCMGGMKPHLPTLLPFLVQAIDHKKALVRSISCWTASRYANWVIYGEDPEQKKKYFEPLLEVLLHHLLDNNKRVQEAACSAFATLEEEAGTNINPYVQPVLNTLVRCFDKYQKKNLIILYDAVGTLAEAVGPELNTPENINIIMPVLMARWNALKEDDHEAFPLFECMSAVALSLGAGFEGPAATVYPRCIKIIQQTLHQSQQATQDPNIEMPDKDLVIVSLDLISAIIQALGSGSSPLVGNAEYPLFQMIAMCMVDYVADVRQSAFALLGDLTMFSFEHVKPHFVSIMSQLIPQIDPGYAYINVCNNATWSAGELALKADKETLAPYIQPMLERLLPLLDNPNTPSTLAENAAITLGRLGLVAPDSIAPHLHQFALKWCVVLAPVRDNDEKSSAFKGMCHLISQRPQAIESAFVPFVHAVLQYQTPDQELAQMFVATLNGLKQLIGDKWEGSLSNIGSEGRELLKQRYNV
ncbi:hypothetical protein H4219_003268 [Mycoemilia scoparia]|uniref:Importin N-terminal domain-containing protein n=1 Tax=Mycoemilia scoparia TaxID=417184 RepID=A0A9W8A385_9FUNG|nr:hypothetical protein H4219_003268 [Mycoemilia scoparia]